MIDRGMNFPSDTTNLVVQYCAETVICRKRRFTDPLADCRPMTQPAESGQGRIFIESLHLSYDATDKQYVFPRQCLVLGDSEVGKTSLVKSLTGKPFDPTQQKTQGVDRCLVDNEWKNCNMKDLVLGDPRKFHKIDLAGMRLSTPGNAAITEYMFINPGLWRVTGIWFIFTFFIMVFFHHKFSFILILIHLICAGHGMFQYCVFHYNSACTINLRSIVDILVTFVFILSRRELLIGPYLALVICYFDESYVEIASTSTFLMLCTFAGTAFVFLFILIGPIQMRFGATQLVKNRNFIVILCFCRILLSLFIGFIIGLAEIRFFVRCTVEKTPFREAFITYPHYRSAVSFLLAFLLEVALEPETQNRIISSIEEGSWGPCNILLVLAFYYLCKLVLALSPLYLANILFLLFICFTICQEWLHIRSIHTIGGCFTNSSITLELLAQGVMDRRMLKRALSEKFPSLKLQILDFAGDKEYYAYHHMFFKSQAIYILVFNIAKHVENNFKNINTAIQRLQFWLESICSHVPPKTPIFLVGTHRGDLDNICLQILNGHCRKHLWDCYYDELVINDVDELIFFPVENSKGENDVGVQTLRLKIMSVAEEREAARDCDIPLSWITIKDAIINQNGKDKAKCCVTLEEFPTTFENFICTNWSEETLKFFHEMGLVIYLDKDPELSNWVLLKPEILVNIIIRLVTPSPQMIQERVFRHDWKLLHDKGMLTKSLLTRIISTVQENEKAMTAFLEEYDLICPLLNNKVKMCSLSDDKEHQPTHLVPSLLPMSTDGCIPTWHDNTTDKRFYVFFKRFLPDPLFHRLLSRAHKNSKSEIPNGPVVMFKDDGKFWMSPSEPYVQPYRLKLMKEEGIIEVTFSSRYSYVRKETFFMNFHGIC